MIATELDSELRPRAVKVPVRNWQLNDVTFITFIITNI